MNLETVLPGFSKGLPRVSSCNTWGSLPWVGNPKGHKVCGFHAEVLWRLLPKMERGELSTLCAVHGLCRWLQSICGTRSSTREVALSS